MAEQTDTDYKALYEQEVNAHKTTKQQLAETQEKLRLACLFIDTLVQRTTEMKTIIEGIQNHMAEAGFPIRD